MIDASVIPTMPSANTNAATPMVAEAGADVILADHHRGAWRRKNGEAHPAGTMLVWPPAPSTSALRRAPGCAVAVVPRQHPERGDQDALGLLLPDRPSAPSLT